MLTVEQMNCIKEERGYSYDTLAAYTGLPRATIVNVLTGVSANPRFTTMIALEKVLGASESEFPGRRYRCEANSRGMQEAFGLAEARPEYETGRTSGITAKQFLSMSPDYPAELIDGKIVRRSEPDFVHSEICEYFYDTFKEYIKKKGGRCRPKVSNTNVLLPPEDGKDTVVCPDFFVICKEEKIDWFGIDGAPDFVLEVVSKDNWRNDYSEKTRKYDFAGVREYWIIDPLRGHLLIFIYDAEAEELPRILPLSGKAGVYIFKNELQIDLDEVRRRIEEFGRK